MSQTLLPRAEAAGLRVLTDCYVQSIIGRGTKVKGVLAVLRHANGRRERIRIDAENVFVCAGATETPSLLRRSGIYRNIGDTFLIHPMLKVAARFTKVVNAHKSVLPLIQVLEFWPDITMGGAFFTTGQLAMLLSDNSRLRWDEMADYRNMAMYYVAVRGTGRGTIRCSLSDRRTTLMRYELSREDIRNLGKGLAFLSSILLAAGASEVYPGSFGVPVIRKDVDAMRWLDDSLRKSSLCLTTVHAFSSCPMGERRDICAVDSFGKLYDFENLYINDASMLPDSPGVNPQGTIMALARRNAMHFVEEHS
jgi:choline dehydrogenase-like flavoprotein